MLYPRTIVRICYIWMTELEKGKKKFVDMKKIFLLLLCLIYLMSQAFSQTIVDYINSGKNKIESGDYYGAISDFSRVLELTPKDMIANTGFIYSQIGSLKFKLKDYPGTISSYNEAIRLDPSSSSNYFFRAIAKEALNDSYGAISDYTRTIELDPSDSYNYYARGNLKSGLNDDEGAIKDYSKAIELKSDEYTYYYFRGRSFDKIKNYPGAIRDYVRTTELNPNYAIAYFALGMLLIDGGVKKEGCENIIKAGLLGYDKAYDYYKMYCK